MRESDPCAPNAPTTLWSVLNFDEPCNEPSIPATKSIFDSEPRSPNSSPKLWSVLNGDSESEASVPGRKLVPQCDSDAHCLHSPPKLWSVLNIDSKQETSVVRSENLPLFLSCDKSEKESRKRQFTALDSAGSPVTPEKRKRLRRESPLRNSCRQVPGACKKKLLFLE